MAEAGAAGDLPSAHRPSLRDVLNLDWYRTLDGPGRVAFWAGSAGWGLATFDALSFTFALQTIAGSLGLSEQQAGVAATVTLVASIAGGILAGALADAIGRVRTLILTIAAYSVFTFLSGLAQSYEQLLAARALLGLGFGGEWTVGALLVAEVAHSAQRGRLQGAFASAYAVGWGLAAGAYAVLFSLLPAALAWRALLWLGLLPALLTLWVRLRLQESPVYLAARAAHGSARQSRPRDSLAAIFGPALLRVTVAGFLLSSGALCGKYVIAIWLPTYLEHTLGLSGASHKSGMGVAAPRASAGDGGGSR